MENQNTVNLSKKKMGKVGGKGQRADGTNKNEQQEGRLKLS